MVSPYKQLYKPYKVNFKILDTTMNMRQATPQSGTGELPIQYPRNEDPMHIQTC
jgi:hypothetical protein